jgi:tetratricopeptide (TPR) repeat protein
MTSTTDITRRHDAAALEAVAAQARGRFGLALDLFEESLRHAEELGERRKIHAARLNISSCFLSLGDWASARSGLAAIILESDSPRHISAAAVQLAEALMKEGRLEKSAHYLRMALEKARQAGDDARIVSALTMQGHVAVMDGRHAEAAGLYAEALDLRRGMGAGSAIDEGVMLDHLGYAQVLGGQVSRGLWTLKSALRTAERRENTWGKAEAHVDLAFGFLLGERNEAAERHALKALALAMEHSYAAIRKNGTYVLMEVALRRDNPGDFERWFRELQALMPDVKLSRDFFRIFDISDVINLKEF